MLDSSRNYSPLNAIGNNSMLSKRKMTCEESFVKAVKKESKRPGARIVKIKEGCIFKMTIYKYV